MNIIICKIFCKVAEPYHVDAAPAQVLAPSKNLGTTPAPTLLYFSEAQQLNKGLNCLFL
jgi:hypothetical protein